MRFRSISSLHDEFFALSSLQGFSERLTYAVCKLCCQRIVMKL